MSGFVIPMSFRWNKVCGEDVCAIDVMKSASILSSSSVMSFASSMGTSEWKHCEERRTCILELCQCLGVDYIFDDDFAREEVYPEFSGVEFITALSATSAAGAIILDADFLQERMRFVKKRLIHTLYNLFPKQCLGLAPRLRSTDGTIYFMGDGAFWDHGAVSSAVKHSTEAVTHIVVFSSDIPTSFENYWCEDAKDISQTLINCPCIFDGRSGLQEFHKNGNFHVVCTDAKVCSKFASRGPVCVHVIGNTLLNDIAIMPSTKNAAYLASQDFANAIESYIDFARQELRNIDDEVISVCLPGGGVRMAAVACCGLKSVDLAGKNIDIVSCTSGGAWGSAIFYNKFRNVNVKEFGNLLPEWVLDLKNKLSENTMETRKFGFFITELLHDVSMVGFDWQGLVGKMFSFDDDASWHEIYSFLPSNTTIIMNSCIVHQ